MMTIWISLTVFMFTGGLCYACNIDAVSQCLEPLENDMIPQELYDYESIDQYRLKKISRDTMTSYCSIYNNEIRDCLAETAQTCTDYRYQAGFQGLQDAIDYLCNEGFEGYMKHLDCFESNRTTTKMTGCGQQVAPRVYSLALDFSEKNINKKLCSILDDGLDCIVDGIEDICGKEASVWVDTFAHKMADPIMDEMDCNTMDVAKLAGIIVGSVVGAAVLLACVCCICAAVRKQRMNRPPAYSIQADVVQRPVPAMAGEKTGPLPNYIETCQGLPVKQV